MTDRHMSPESFWQEILPADVPTHSGYPARLEDGRILLLPIRHLPDGKHALASLIINQASFAVVDVLADVYKRQSSTCCCRTRWKASSPIRSMAAIATWWAGKWSASQVHILSLIHI